MKRFSVSLDTKSYRRLTRLATSYRPPLTLQYLVQFAVQDLLEKAEDKQLDLGLTLPRLPKDS